MYQTEEVVQYSAFTRDPRKGNPAGIVFDAGRLSAEQMQRVAALAGFNETAFVCPSEQADFRLRYFTPGHEMDLCGHATVGALAALVDRDMITVGMGESAAATIETRAAVLPLRVKRHSGVVEVQMRQASAQFQAFHGSLTALAAALGLELSDLDDGMPVVYGSTGTWTLLLPIRSLAAFQRMRPDNARFPNLLRELPRASVHPFCAETYDPAARFHARHFSSPYSGTIEDPVTGTASGVMGAYVLRYLSAAATEAMVVEQGHEAGRDGRVTVRAWREGSRIEAEITGTAVAAGTATVDLT